MFFEEYINLYKKLLLKGTVSRDILTLFFFHQTSSPSLVRHAWKGFQIFSNIRGVIRVCNRLPGVFTTGELRLPGVFITGEL